APFLQFMSGPLLARAGGPNIADFEIRNPHDLPLSAFTDALSRSSVPQHKDWFAYPLSLPEAQSVVERTLRERYAMPFEAKDIALTNGAFAALAVALAAVVDPGDEVIFISPPWFFYELLIAAGGGQPVRVQADPQTSDLDLDAIAAAITPQTRAIIVNSPN